MPPARRPRSSSLSGVSVPALRRSRTRADTAPSDPLLATNVNWVLARWFLTVGSLQKSQASTPRCRIHAARAVLPPPCTGNDSAAVGAEQASTACAEPGPRGRSRDTIGHDELAEARPAAVDQDGTTGHRLKRSRQRRGSSAWDGEARSTPTALAAASSAACPSTSRGNTHS